MPKCTSSEEKCRKSAFRQCLCQGQICNSRVIVRYRIAKLTPKTSQTSQKPPGLAKCKSQTAGLLPLRLVPLKAWLENDAVDFDGFAGFVKNGLAAGDEHLIVAGGQTMPQAHLKRGAVLHHIF